MKFVEAKDYAIEKGKEFIRAFERFFVNRKTNPTAMDESLESMQTIWKEMAGLQIINHEGFVGIITNIQLVEWFFTSGANPRDFMDMPDEDIGYDYDRFLLHLLYDRAHGSYPSVENAARFMMV